MKCDLPRCSFAHPDHLSTPVKVTDGGGEVVWEMRLKPFGAVVHLDKDADGNVESLYAGPAVRLGKFSVRAAASARSSVEFVVGLGWSEDKVSPAPITRL